MIASLSCGISFRLAAFHLESILFNDIVNLWAPIINQYVGLNSFLNHIACKNNLARKNKVVSLNYGSVNHKKSGLEGRFFYV
jgi:hypothetical protein